MHSIDVSRMWSFDDAIPSTAERSTEPLRRKPPVSPLSRRLAGHGLLRRAQPVEIGERLLFLLLFGGFVSMASSFVLGALH